MARKHWLIKHRLQAKYLWVVAVAMAAPALVLGACLYYLVFEMLARQIAFPEAVAANLEPVIRRVNLMLLIALPLLFLAVLRLALVISHRFAGPIERMESELDHILAGDTQRRLRTRDDDDLKGIATRINAILAAKR